MGQKSRVGRPRKNTVRVELRLNADDPMTKALRKEAAGRSTTIQQHVTDILIARYLGASAPIAPVPTPDADNATALSAEFM